MQCGVLGSVWTKNPPKVYVHINDLPFEGGPLEDSHVS